MHPGTYWVEVTSMDVGKRSCGELRSDGSNGVSIDGPHLEYAARSVRLSSDCTSHELGLASHQRGNLAESTALWASVSEWRCSTRYSLARR